MMNHPLNLRSERGIALIVVLLLLGVMAALTTGLTLSGQAEVAMSANEKYYAGARAAAEAGMNRAVNQILADVDTNLLEDGTVPNIGNGPFELNSQYSYSFQIVDDDDPVLYPAATVAQLAVMAAQMGENNDPADDNNTRMILRCIGTGPNGTTVTVSRVLQSTEIPDLPDTDTLISNPAILVNGDLDISGNLKVLGTRGNIHANGDITGGGSLEITGDVTATGTVENDITAGGMVAGNQPAVAIPEIKAADYKNLADYILGSDGLIRVAATNAVCGAACPSNNNWTWTGSVWRAAGASPTTGTYYAQTAVEIHGTGNNPAVKMSVIAEGSIKLTGNGKFSPENGAGIQFVTNGDFELGGTVLAEDTTVDFDGQIMAREQLKLYGTSKFQGRVMAENRDSASNAWDAVNNPNGRKGASTLTENSASGNMTVTYNGSLGDIVTEITLPGGDPAYTNNIVGWLEQ